MFRVRTLSLLLFLLPLTLGAADPVNTTWWRNLAIKGYDPVAYFTLSKAVKGKKEFETKWNGAVWRFATRDHLYSFKADPEKYAPAYGGYCAWAVSRGDTADIDPEEWSIVDGRLFLNYNRAIHEKWSRKKETHIRRADQNWPGIRDG